MKNLVRIYCDKLFYLKFCLGFEFLIFHLILSQNPLILITPSLTPYLFSPPPSRQPHEPTITPTPSPISHQYSSPQTSSPSLPLQRTIRETQHPQLPTPSFSFILFTCKQTRRTHRQSSSSSLSFHRRTATTTSLATLLSAAPSPHHRLHTELSPAFSALTRQESHTESN